MFPFAPADSLPINIVVAGAPVKNISLSREGEQRGVACTVDSCLSSQYTVRFRSPSGVELQTSTSTSMQETFNWQAQITSGLAGGNYTCEVEWDQGRRNDMAVFQFAGECVCTPATDTSTAWLGWVRDAVSVTVCWCHPTHKTPVKWTLLFPLPSRHPHVRSAARNPTTPLPHPREGVVHPHFHDDLCCILFAGSVVAVESALHACTQTIRGDQIESKRISCKLWNGYTIVCKVNLDLNVQSLNVCDYRTGLTRAWSVSASALVQWSC